MTTLDTLKAALAAIEKGVAVSPFDKHATTAALREAIATRWRCPTIPERLTMSDIEAMSEARAIAIYEAVNDDASTRTPWTHLSPGEWAKWRRAANMTQQPAVLAYTEGHCAEKRKPGGCQLHNLHCGYPACDRKAAAPQPPRAPARTPLTDMEIHELWWAKEKSHPGSAHLPFARAVLVAQEAKS